MSPVIQSLNSIGRCGYTPVQFTYRSHKFRIPLTMDVDGIRRKVGRYFAVDMERFVLEIYDQRLDMHFLLNDLYLTKMHNDIHTNNSFSGRIRSINQPIYNTQFDTIESKDSSTETTSPQPDHIVIWLDKYIGDLCRYQQLKNYFKSIISIEWPNFFSLQPKKDIDNLIRINDSKSVNNVNINHIRDEIYTFTTAEDCLIFIEKVFKSRRRIFFICSGSLAADIIPKIFESKFVHFIYIFTLDILKHYEWACNYTDKMLLFSHELDLLARLTRDIARYYMEKSSEQKTKNPRHALTYLGWTKHLLKNANVIDDSETSKYNLRCVHQQIMSLELAVKDQIEYEDHREELGIACTEVSVDFEDSREGFFSSYDLLCLN